MRMNRLNIFRVLLPLAVVGIGVQVIAQDTPAPQARVDISGDWLVVTHEDNPSYGAGPELGDYTGMPITAAARQRAEAWDASILSQQERQSQSHPVQYLGNNRGPARITKILDPVTEVQLGYSMAGGFGRPDKIVWTDGRPHPSDFSEHTWNGFSTGRWQDGMFIITTTHMKTGNIRRNGTFVTPYSRMTEYFIRTGTEIHVFVMVEDPIALEEPVVRTYTLRWNPNGNTTAAPVFESVEEVDMPLGWVPFWPMGMKQREFAERYKVPFEATQGGAEVMYPEYQQKLQQMLRAQQPAR